MLLKGLNHLAFITDDMTKTVRFYRDLLGMELVAGVGHGGFRHYFFQMESGQIAFFEYDIAKPMERGKFHGAPTDRPIGFDHVALTVETKAALFQLRDKLEAAGIEVHGAVDHGTIWSIYFFDPHNNIPLEASWDCVEQIAAPAIYDEDPLPIAAEGAGRNPATGPRSPAIPRPSGWSPAPATASSCARVLSPAAWSGRSRNSRRKAGRKRRNRVAVDPLVLPSPSHRLPRRAP